MCTDCKLAFCMESARKSSSSFQRAVVSQKWNIPLLVNGQGDGAQPWVEPHPLLPPGVLTSGGFVCGLKWLEVSPPPLQATTPLPRGLFPLIGPGPRIRVGRPLGRLIGQCSASRSAPSYLTPYGAWVRRVTARVGRATASAGPLAVRPRQYN